MFARGQDQAVHVSEQQVIQHGQDLAVILLNSVTLMAVSTALLIPGTPESTGGVAILGLLACWSGYRLITRSRALIFQAIDFCYVLGIAAAVPLFNTDPHALYTNSVPQVIAGTAVITFTMAQRPTISLPAALAITAMYAVGCARLVGWQEVIHIPVLHYMVFVEWTITAALLAAALGVARAVDQARAENHDAALRDTIAAAVRDYELEHLALVHDTAASTLYLVGEGAEISPERLATQARRDLALLTGEPAGLEPSPDTDIVAAIERETQHLATAVSFSGLPRLVLDGGTARAVVAVVREALNNAERHANASRIDIAIAPTTLSVTDNGVGFDPATTTLGHGVAESIVARMRRADGSATVLSTPGGGTVVTINWHEPHGTGPPVPTIDDIDELTERILIRFGLGIVAFALVQVLVSVPYAVMHTAHPGAQIGLGVAASLAALAGVPRVLNRGPNLTVLALLTMAVVVIVQSLLLPPDMLGIPAQWPLAAVGVCILPLMLRWWVPRAAAVMIAFWLGIVLLNFVREPTMSTVFTLALYTAGITLVQMFILVFPALLRSSTAAAAAEIRERWAKADQRRIADALHDDYVRRTAKLIRGVFPLLQTLATGTIDAEIRRRARLESRRLRLYIFQSRTFNHPLVAELRPAIEDADRRGVVVTLNSDSDLPPLNEKVRRRLLAPIQAVLARGSGRARIGLTVAPGELVVSIICDAPEASIPTRSTGSDGERIEVTRIGSTVWVSVHQALPVAECHDEDQHHGIA